MTQITVPNVATSVEYSVTSSSTGPFTVTFPFFEEDDCQVLVTDTDGVESELVVTTDFTFDSKDTPVGQEGSGYSGGAISLNVAVGADGDTAVKIYRSTTIDRNSNFPNTGPFSVPILNDEENRIFIILQELQAAVLTNATYRPALIETPGDELPNDTNTTTVLTYTDSNGCVRLIDPSVSQIIPTTDDYTFLLCDGGKTLSRTGSTAGVAGTIPAEASVDYRIGTFLGFNNDGTDELTIEITSDTLTWADDNTTGTLELAAGGYAVAQKVASTKWKIAGKQLSRP